MQEEGKTGKFAVHVGAPILSLFCYLHFTHLRERERERVKERDRE